MQAPEEKAGMDVLETNGPGHEKLHEWFGLSYAAYLTVPRAVLQSLPDDIQGRLADMLSEMDAFCDAHGLVWPPSGTGVYVYLRDDDTKRFVKDDLCRYERGRRRLWSTGRTLSPRGD